MNVLVITEDFRRDRYMLKPLFDRLFRSIGRRQANVQVYQNPPPRGVSEALKSERLAYIVERYRGMISVFILCVDRDGEEGRCQRLDQIENEFGNGVVFFAENAWEEIETWVLAGLDLPRGWAWADVRAEVHVKERYFDVVAEERGVTDGPGGGRKALGEEAARRIPRVRQRCPEDFDALAQRLQAVA